MARIQAGYAINPDVGFPGLVAEPSGPISKTGA